MMTTVSLASSDVSKQAAEKQLVHNSTPPHPPRRRRRVLCVYYSDSNSRCRHARACLCAATSIPPVGLSPTWRCRKQGNINSNTLLRCSLWVWREALVGGGGHYDNQYVNISEIQLVGCLLTRCILHTCYMKNRSVCTCMVLTLVYSRP